jgi:drug/metabolite transporter (DMT)-like permease
MPTPACAACGADHRAPNTIEPTMKTAPLPPDAAKAQRMRLIGIALMCGAVACFACLDASAKFLGHHVDMIEVIWARYVSAFLLALLISNPITRPGLMRSRRPWLQIVRSALLMIATGFNFFSFKWLQLDQALVIGFSIPLIVAVLAGPILSERVGPRRWAAIIVGMFGVILVAQPGFGSVHPAALLSFMSATCTAFYFVMTRVLARHDSNETTLFYSNLVGAVALMPVVPWVWTTPTEPFVIFLMITFGAFGSLGHYLLIIAHRHTPASVLSPFLYSQLAWTTTLGFVVFGDVPNRWTLIGGAVVVASGLYLLHRERVRGRR